jgi:fatty acid desaturase
MLGFTVQSTHMLLVSRRRGYLSAREQRWALVETALGVGVWAVVACVMGALPFLFAFVLPLLFANTIVMAHILTNHSLSPRGDVNDPLQNSLSVTVPRFIEWLTLGFGYHVEHHLFPAMSTRHAPRVRDALRRLWPERYQSMPLGDALRALHLTPRVYKDDQTLIDPSTGSEWQVLTGEEVARVSVA